MKCPKCGSTQVGVMNTRATEGNEAIYRRRACRGCGLSFGTLEIVYPAERRPNLEIVKEFYSVNIEALQAYRDKHLADADDSDEKTVATALDRMLPLLKSLGPMFVLPVYPGKGEQDG